MSVRVRYAPSPTGSPHVGNIRTALFDDLLAKKHKGTMILRIEDTDRSRFVPGCEEEIIESAKWIGIDWQEGPDKEGPFAPYRQSERKDAGIYDPWVEKLFDSGAVYWAFDTPEELEEMREYQKINKQPIGYYGGTWRDAQASAVEAARKAGKPGVIRLAIPRNRTLFCKDAIRGRIEWDSNTVDDPVLIKADGMPTYHFAAMVDDHLMEITHVIRGEEWISSAPKHVWLFEALGVSPPEFVHVPVIKGKDGTKLSKRHGDTRCLDFRDAGYLPEALANFIALIGWAPGGDREIMNPKELVEAFDLSGLQPAPGVFDIDKLHWMNGSYIRSFDAPAIAARTIAYASAPETRSYWMSPDRNEKIYPALELLAKAAAESPEFANQAIALEQERVVTLADFGIATEFFFVDKVNFDNVAVEKWLRGDYVRHLFDYLIQCLQGKESSTVEECEHMIREYAKVNHIEKLGQVVHPTRVALTGKTVGPGLFELMSVLGPKRMIERLESAMPLLVPTKA